MEKEHEKKIPEVIILSEHEKIEAEEYVEDADHVYRKKDQVFKRFKFSSSTFWLRLAWFFGLLAIAIVLILRFIKLLVAFIVSAFQFFKDRSLNHLLKSAWKEFTNAALILTGLAVGVINPRWGMGLMSLFFSVNREKARPPLFNRFFRFCGF